MSRARTAPQRSCMGCGLVDAQRSLVRIVHSEAGDLRVDAQRRAGGRGGYLHSDPRCWTRFAQRKGSLRSFRASVDRPARTALVAQLAQQAGGVR